MWSEYLGGLARPLLACVLLVAGLSCSDHEKTGQGGAPSQPPSPTGKGAPADHSLTAEEYIRGGMPAPDRTWGGADMARAAQTLAAIARADAGHLPRFRSERSGAVFARMTAEDNLALYRNRSLPLELRTPDAMSYMQSSNGILKLYLSAFGRRAVSGAELVELMGAQLRFSVVMLQLIGEFLPTLDKNDPSYAIRMDGLAQVRRGLAGTVAGSIQSLSEREAYGAPELKMLLAHMEASLPAILPELPSGSRLEMVVRLKSLCSDARMADLRPELARLLRAVEGAAKQSD